MTRRLASNALQEVALRRRVAGGPEPVISAADMVSQVDAVDTEAYRKGYAEGFAAGEIDGERAASEKSLPLEALLEERLKDLQYDRERLKQLIAGVESAVQNKMHDMEVVAFEIAHTGITYLLGDMQKEHLPLKQLCNQMVQEFRNKALQIRIASADQAVVPGTIQGLHVVVDEALSSGECVVETACGQSHASLATRLEALHSAMRGALGIDP